MARPDKVAAVAELTEDFRTSTATVLTEYRGLSVTSMKQLRRNLGSTTKYSVVKNTLTKIAAKEAGFDVPNELLVGPSALAFIKGDPIVAAKSLRVTAAEIFKLADLESREVLLAKLAGAMKGTISKAARVFDALRIKMEAGAPAAPVAVTEEVLDTPVAVTEEVLTPVEEKE
jgi:large subunit ribosomal protein L10